MTTTDPTITIAGLRARINSLLSAVQHSNRTTAERVTMFVEASSNADRLTAERDALAAQLAEVRAELAAAPKVCAIHSYALEGPCMTCGAPWPGAEKALRQERIEGMEKMRRISRAVGCPNSVEEVVEAVAALKSNLASERAHLATCRTRIAGLEQAANERSAEVARLTEQLEAAQAAGWETVKAENQRAISAEAEVARLTNERSEWIHAAVSIGEHVDHLGPVAIGAGETNPREWIHYAHGLAGRVKARIGALTARVAEIEARPVLTEERLRGALFACADGASDAEVRAILAALGPVMLPAQDRAEELCRAYHERAADMDGHMVGRWQYHGPESQAICTEAMRHAIASLGAPPTSPTAARPVFAGVSEDDLCVQMLMAADPSIDPGVALTMVNGVHRAKVRAVLTRLKTTLVAPVDPEVVARAYHDHKDAPAPEWDEVDTWRGRDSDEQHLATAAMRAVLAKRGIPVTPEVGK